MEKNPCVKIKVHFQRNIAPEAFVRIHQILYKFSEICSFEISPKTIRNLLKVISTVVSLMPKVLPYYLEVRDPWWGARFLWSYDWRSLCLASSLHLLKLMAALLHCLKKQSSSSEYTAKLSGDSGTGSPSPWDTGRIADGIFGYTSVDFFLHGHAILNTGHHTEITVSTVIARHPSNHGHSKRHITSLSIHPRILFGWTRSVAHVWCPFFVLVPYLTAEIQIICLFYSWSIRTLPWGKCLFSANIAEVIRVIYALLGHFYK